MQEYIDLLNQQFPKLSIEIDSYKGKKILLVKGYQANQGCLAGKKKDIAIILNNDFPCMPPAGLHISDPNNQILLNNTCDLGKRVMDSSGHQYRTEWKYISRKNVFGEEWNTFSGEAQCKHYINFIDIVFSKFNF